MPQGSQVLPHPEGPQEFPLQGPHWRCDSSLPFADCFAIDPSDVVWAPEAAGTQCLDRAVFIEKLGDKICAFLSIFQKEFCWVLV